MVFLEGGFGQILNGTNDLSTVFCSTGASDFPLRINLGNGIIDGYFLTRTNRAKSHRLGLVSQADVRLAGMAQ